jgi:hypothetical protein
VHSAYRCAAIAIQGGSMLVGYRLARSGRAPALCAAVHCAAWLVALACIVPASAAEEPPKGSSTREDRQKAIEAIPLDKLDDAARAKVSVVLKDVSIFRRMPTEVVRCDPELYLFLVNRPDAVVNLWEVLGISEVHLRQTGKNTYRADDGHGTLCDFEFLHRSHDFHVIYAEGSYVGPLFNRQIKGKCVMTLRAGFVRETDGHYYVTHRLDAFCKLENVGADLLAKSIHPLVGKVADRNFSEISSFMGSISRKLEHDADWGQRIAGKLENVHPTVREAFSKLAAKLAAAAEEQAVRESVKTAARDGGPKDGKPDGAKPEAKGLEGKAEPKPAEKKSATKG